MDIDVKTKAESASGAVEKSTKNIEPLHRRALIEPSSVKVDERTFTVAFASETPVLMSPWWADSFFEVLGMEGMRTARLDSGAPLLDNHERYGSVKDSVIGVVLRHWVEGTTAYAEVKLSAREELSTLIQDVKDGIIRNISCGYRVYSYSEKPMVAGEKIPTYRATDWEPFEVSLVPVGADHTVSVRSNGGDSAKNEVSILSQKRNMDPETKAPNVAPVPPAVPSVDIEQQRALAAQEATAAERKRVAEINQAVRSLKLGQEFADKLIAEGVAIDGARQRAIEEWEKAAPKGVMPHAEVKADETDKYRSLAVAALAQRSSEVKTDSFSKDEIGGVGQFRGMTLLDIAKRSLEREGVNYQGMTKMELVSRAISNSTSDLPVILEGTNRRILLANYEATADTWRNFCSTGSVGDFREYKRLRMGSFSRLEKVLEGASYKSKPIPEADFEKVSANTFGNTINLSRQMIINDDLAAFARLAAMLGRAAARSIEVDVYALLAENSNLGPTMQDGLTLFHATHANIASAAAPSVDTFDAMRVLMASQKDPSGNDFLDIRPAIGLYPIGLGGNARVIIGAQYDPDTANKLQRPNKVNGLLSQIVDTARLTGTRHYMFADPSEEPVIEVSFLDGMQTPYLENETTFDVDGLRWKIRLDYGVGAVGWRGAVTNAGA